MSKRARLLSGKVKKVSGAELDPSRSDFLDLSNAEPDLDLPSLSGSLLVSTNTGERSWTDKLLVTNDDVNIRGTLVAPNAELNQIMAADSSTISVESDLIVQGNFTVQGTTTTIESTTLAIDDKNIELAKNATTALEADGAGITIIGPTTPATILYDSNLDRLEINKVVAATVTDITTDVITSQSLLAEADITSADLVLVYDDSASEFKKVSIDSITNQGSDGVDGAPGFTGSIGFTGSKGDQGAIGFTGSQGPPGAGGADGVGGFTGSQGNTGFVGSQGEIGFTGSQGDTGFTGSQGDIGYTGSQGDFGYTGSIGFVGSIGFTGSQGDQGTLGFTGSQGPPGPGGVDGSGGFTGSQGTTGYTGSRGYTGSQGDAGARTFEVTNSGTSGYIIDATTNPTLELLRGFTYIFDVNATGHPFYLQSVSGGYDANNILQSGDGVSNNGAQSGKVIFNVPYNAPSTLYYYCQFHSSMGGQINISDLGPRGYTGSAGPIGYTGSAGADGADGTVGFTGSQGPPGEGGEGSVGYTGSRGEDGVSGYTGSQGVIGFTGSSGVGVSNLDDLADVTITTPSSGQILKYNGTGWINDAAGSGSGTSVNYFVKTYNYQGILRTNTSTERLIIHDTATLETIKIALGTAGNVDTQLRINKNNTAFLTTTIAAGDRYKVEASVNESLSANDLITVDILANSSARDLFVTFIYYTN